MGKLKDFSSSPPPLLWFVLRQGLTLAQASLKLRDLLASASQVVRRKVCTTVPRKRALVCLVRTCSYKKLPRQPSRPFKFQVLSSAPSMKAAFQSNPRLFCNFFFFFMYLGFGLLTCEFFFFSFVGFNLRPLSLDNFRYVLAGVSKFQPVASSCVLLFGGPSVARTDKENLSFCPGGRRSTFLLSPGQL